MEGVRVLERFSAPVLIVLTVALLGWVTSMRAGSGMCLRCRRGMLGVKRIRLLAKLDYRSSFTEVIFDKIISNPIQLLAKIGGLTTMILAITGISLATITTNIAANMVAPANALVNLNPSVFTFRKGAFLTALLGIAFQPWSLLKSSRLCLHMAGWLLRVNAKTVRLRSHHNKYLVAGDDQEGVSQDRQGGSKRARWTIEYIENGEGVNLVRLKSCYSKYLTATNEPFFMGVTGMDLFWKKVFQTLPRRLDSSVEWEPIKEYGKNVKLKTRYGNFLRANGGVPPWRNSITHDVPSRSHTQDWILWEIEILDVYPPKSAPEKLDHCDSEPFTFRSEPGDSSCTPMKNNGSLIYYNIVDDEGNIVNEADEPLSLLFKGHGVDELKEQLEEETGLEDTTVGFIRFAILLIVSFSCKIDNMVVLTMLNAEYRLLLQQSLHLEENSLAASLCSPDKEHSSMICKFRILEPPRPVSGHLNDGVEGTVEVAEDILVAAVAAAGMMMFNVIIVGQLGSFGMEFSFSVYF
ncbi:Purine-uracil permease NCS1-like protein [Drosera capensis]